MSRTIRVLIALLPLGFTPVLFWLIAEAYLNLGGGEKDIILIFPWMLWSIFYGVAFLLESRRTKGIGKAAFRGACWSTGSLFVLWMALYVFSRGWLGM